MPFSAGVLCCSSDACVLLDISGASGTEQWDKIPHVTQIATTETATTPKLVTSDTQGREISACGTVATTGTLAIACHKGNAPGILCINGIYRIRWSEDCDNIWDGTAAVPDLEAGIYFEALIRITSIPFDFNIAGNQALVFNYGFDIAQWITLPDCQQQEII